MKIVTLFICLTGAWVGTISAQEEAASSLKTRVYTAPIGFHVLLNYPAKVASDPQDPFAPETNTLATTPKPRDYFTSRGVNFPSGSSMIYSPGRSQIIVRNSENELQKFEALLEQIHEEQTPSQKYITVEFIEVEGALYHNWMFENRINGLGTPLRKQAQKWVKAGDATVLETAMVTARSGQRAKTQGIEEVIYPTEPGVPEVPNEVTLEGEETASLVVGATGSAFETRYLGTTLEVDPVLGIDNVTIDLNLAPEMVRRNGYTDWPPEEALENQTISMPRFHKIKVTTQVTTHHGEYAFLGTCRPLKSAVEARENPIVLIFVRADVSRVGPSLRVSTEESK